jgi:hypothetical protein
MGRRSGLTGLTESLSKNRGLHVKTALTPLSRDDLQQLIDTVLREAALYLGGGRVADYIPELARIEY